MISKIEFERVKPIILAFFILIGLYAGCDESFSPNENLIDAASIHCMLDNRNTNIIVKVKKVYFDNSPVDMSMFRVFLLEALGSQHLLKDTVIGSALNSKYFTIESSLLKRGRNYLLTLLKNDTIISQSGCFFPAKPELRYIDTIMEAEGVNKWNVEFFTSIKFPPCFLFRFLLEYEYEKNGITRHEFIEAPISISVDPQSRDFHLSKKIYDYDYDKLDKRFATIHLAGDISTHQFKLKDKEYSIMYDGYNIYSCLKSLKNKISSTISIKGAKAVFYNIDSLYYEYFMRKDNSPWSIRMDQNIYNSNILSSNGYNLGFFGAITADTISLKVPDYLIKFCGYKNNQNY